MTSPVASAPFIGSQSYSFQNSTGEVSAPLYQAPVVASTVASTTIPDPSGQWSPVDSDSSGNFVSVDLNTAFPQGNIVLFLPTTIKTLLSWLLMLGFTFLGFFVLAVSIGWVAIESKRESLFASR